MKGVIIEYFSSDKLYPNQLGNFWVKFNTSAMFDRISIHYYDELGGITEIIPKNQLKPFLWNKQEGSKGLHNFYFNRNSIVLDGFFSFDYIYTLLPDKETTITFDVFLLNQGKIIAQQKMEVDIIRPILISNKRFFEVNDSEYVSNLDKVLITNIGSATAMDIKLIPLISNSKIKVKLSDSTIEKSEYDFIESVSYLTSIQISISGKGFASVRLNIHYSDEIGNKYSSLLGEILVSYTSLTHSEINVPLMNLNKPSLTGVNLSSI